MSRRRTLKRYVELYKNPTLLDPAKPSAESAEVILFPNGEREIWIKGPGGRGFSVKVSNGPHGLGLTIRSFIGSSGLTAFGGRPDSPGVDGAEIEIVQYDDRPIARAFRRWYEHLETEDDLALLGDSYRRTNV